MTDFSRRTVLRGAFAGAAALAMPSLARDDLAPIYDQIGKRHDEAVKRIQTWIHQPTIAAESVGNDEGAQMMINLVLVAEGEEEIGSPHFPQIVRRPEIMEALKKTQGIWMRFAAQGLDGSVSVNLGAKGVIECEMIASGEKWGRGPAKDIHSSLR